MFRPEDNKCYSLPPYFGGWDYDPELQSCYGDTITLVFSYTTDGNRLSDYVPEGFELIKPALNVSYQQCRQVDWMAGSGYNLVNVSVPVRFIGKRDRLEGDLVLVMWENRTTPILIGRDLGVPKIFADVEDLHILGQTYRTCASYEGNTFLRMEMTATQPVDDQQVKALSSDQNTLGWRYVPKVGGPGAELSQTVLFPMRCELDSAWIGRGTLQWTELTPEQHPRQYPIIKALADLPMIEMASVMVGKGRQFLFDGKARVLK